MPSRDPPGVPPSPVPVPGSGSSLPDPQRRRLGRWLGGCAAVAALPPAATAQTPTPTPTPGDGRALEALLRAVVEDEDAPLPSLSALVVRRGAVAWQGQFGHRRLHPRDPASHLPVTADTFFRVAAVSKLVVAVAALRLVERGLLSLDEDIGEVLRFAVRHPQRPDVPVTLRRLLSHTAGIGDGAGIRFPADMPLRTVLQRPAGADSPWRALADERPAASPFGFACSKLAFGVVATAMEAATSERFDRLMAQLVLRPLRMAGDFNLAAFSDDERAQVATLYRKAPGDAGPWDPAGPWVPQFDDLGDGPVPLPAGLDAYRPGTNGTLFAPQGGLRVRVADLGRLMLGLLHDGPGRDVRLLQPASLRALRGPQWQRERDGGPDDGDAGGLLNAYGLGLQHITDRSAPGEGDRLVEGGGYRPLGHFGLAYGLSAGLWFDPATRDGIVYAIGGTPRDPATRRGRWSGLPRWEERVADALVRHARGGA